jgi:hypothetical protein
MRDDHDLRHPTDDEEPDPDVLPEGAPRGGITVPTPNDTGITTPPISGWGDTPVREDEEANDPAP